MDLQVKPTSKNVDQLKVYVETLPDKSPYKKLAEYEQLLVETGRSIRALALVCNSEQHALINKLEDLTNDNWFTVSNLEEFKYIPDNYFDIVLWSDCDIESDLRQVLKIYTKLKPGARVYFNNLLSGFGTMLEKCLGKKDLKKFLGQELTKTFENSSDYAHLVRKTLEEVFATSIEVYTVKIIKLGEENYVVLLKEGMSFSPDGSLATDLVQVDVMLEKALPAEVVLELSVKEIEDIRNRIFELFVDDIKQPWYYKLEIEEICDILVKDLILTVSECETAGPHQKILDEEHIMSLKVALADINDEIDSLIDMGVLTVQDIMEQLEPHLDLQFADKEHWEIYIHSLATEKLQPILAKTAPKVSIFVDGEWLEDISVIDGLVNIDPDNPDSIPVPLSSIPEEFVQLTVDDDDKDEDDDEDEDDEDTVEDDDDEDDDEDDEDTVEDDGDEDDEDTVEDDDDEDDDDEDEDDEDEEEYYPDIPAPEEPIPAILLPGLENIGAFSCFMDSVLFSILLPSTGYFQTNLIEKKLTEKNVKACGYFEGEEEQGLVYMKNFQSELRKLANIMRGNEEPELTCYPIVQQLKKCGPIPEGLMTGQEQDDSEFLIALMQMFHLTPTTVTFVRAVSNDGKQWIEKSVRKERAAVLEVTIDNVEEIPELVSWYQRTLINNYKNVDKSAWPKGPDTDEGEESKEIYQYSREKYTIDSSDTLIFHVARRQVVMDIKGPKYVKNTLPVIFTEYIEQKDEKYFGLQAVTIHRGGAYGGHYTAYFKYDSQWFYYDDTAPSFNRVRQASWEEVFNIGTTNGSLFIYTPIAKSQYMFL